jgi:hypothetical protein
MDALQRDADLERAATVIPCLGCGGLVPDALGPVHPYMRASPGCWALYGQIGVRVGAGVEASVGRWHHVDAYAVQHPGGAATDRRQRQSIAVHLVSLCLLHEFGAPPEQASARRNRISALVLPRMGLADWPYLAPPADRGSVTAANVYAAADSPELTAVLMAWTQSAWTAWAAHHETIRTWAAAAWQGSS